MFLFHIKFFDDDPFKKEVINKRETRNLSGLLFAKSEEKLPSKSKTFK
jgi:hypothetical protein